MQPFCPNRGNSAWLLLLYLLACTEAWSGEASPAAPADMDATVVVETFTFEGNTAIPSAALADALQDYMGRRLSFLELLEVETVITDLYVAGGYVNSGAFVPAGQALDPDGATVRILVVEGGLEDVRLEVEGRLRPGPLRRRLARACEAPLDQNRLLATLQLLQLDPNIKTIQANLASGAQPEKSLLDVRVVTANPFHATLFTDNQRATGVGSIRSGLRLEHTNVLGFGDTLDFTYTHTEGSDAFDLGYRVPINTGGGTVALRGAWTASEVIEEPFDRIDITGDSRVFELTYRQPLFRTASRELALGLTASHARSQTFLLGTGLPLSAGAEDDGTTRVNALRFFQEWTARGKRQVFALHSSVSLGVNALNATIHDDAYPDGRFLSWRTQWQYVRRTWRDSLLVWQGDFQFANHALVPMEQFSLGGACTVRGYRQDTLLTDMGLATTLEWRIPVLPKKTRLGTLHLCPFLDAGRGWNGMPTADPEKHILVGAGVGLKYAFSDKVTARLDYGVPLRDFDQNGTTWQEKGFTFSLSFTPF